MRTGLTVVLLASLVATTSLAAAAGSGTGGGTAMPDRALFIGNSHTYSNGGVDWHIERMAQSMDPPHAFHGDSVTKGGATLADHYEMDSQGRIPFGDYDVVVLQGHIPAIPAKSTDSFYEHARLLDAAARRNGARTVFYMSWAHPEVHWIKHRDIVKAHREIADELGAEVAPVAVAIRRASRMRPDLKMFGPDGVHVSWAGSYLASAVIFATLFDHSPKDLGYTYGVSEEDASFLQELAWQTVTEWRGEQQTTASEG